MRNNSVLQDYESWYHTTTHDESWNHTTTKQMDELMKRYFPSTTTVIEPVNTNNGIDDKRTEISDSNETTSTSIYTENISVRNMANERIGIGTSTLPFDPGTV